MTIDLESTDLAEVEAVFETDKGTMVCELLADRAPKTVRNFCKLAQDGYYDGLRFHRIIRDFMVQTGCPRGDGTGGPGWTIEAEFNETPHTRGVLSMARTADPNSAGSQFFIVHGEHASHLDGQYTAFGRVTDGLDVLDALASVPVRPGASGEASSPIEEVRIVRLGLRARAAGDAGAEAGDAGGEAGDAGGEGEPGGTQ